MSATPKLNTGRSSQFVDSAAPTSFQNAIIASQVVGSNADFFSVAGLNLTLMASAGNPFKYDINGLLHVLTANVVMAVTDNANNFVWLDDTGALGVSVFPPIYSFATPGAPATDQHWFDLGANQMMRWNGAAFVAVNRIFIGYVRADTGTIAARYACEPIGMTPLNRFNMFGNGTDGFLEVTAGTTTLDGLKRYTAVVVRGSGALAHTAANNTPLNLQAQGPIVLSGSGGINLNGLGLPGGAGAASSGIPGDPGEGGGLGGAGGGGGGFGTDLGGAGGNHINSSSIFSSGGGVGGGNGTAGTGNGLSGNGFSAPILFGYGNGGGGSAVGLGTGATGGNGGGTAMVQAPVVAIATTASIHANGTAGVPGGLGSFTASGGGGGGVVLIFSRNFFNSGTITTTGGAGGVGGTFVGGAGAAGFSAQISL